MLAGNAVVAIWNGIAPPGREDFYAWHLHEHMPERAAIPSFTRGRRYIATSPGTHPEFFTLYEADTMAVLQGSDYLARLNAPTPWTRSATSHFTDTSRALARVLASAGPGMGGVMLTIRFAAPDTAVDALTALVHDAAALPRITGAHLCAADADASGASTRESAGRTDIQAPPTWFAMVEATDEAALATILPAEALSPLQARVVARGVYRLEHVRGKTDAA